MKTIKTHGKKNVKERKGRKKEKEVLINLCCGVDLYPGYINVDKYLTEKQLRKKEGVCANADFPPTAKFVQADITKLPFKDNYADYIECLEGLEHLPFRDVELAIKEIYRVLKPGGEATLLVPDLDDMCYVWREQITGKPFNPQKFFTIAQQFYGNQLHDGEYHTAAFNTEYFKGLLQACGFDPKNIEIEAFAHDEHIPLFRGADPKVWDPRKVFIIGMIRADVKK